MTFSPVFTRPMAATFDRRAAIAVANWWDAGGATGCLGAYLAKGAASLADSYINLVSPGTYNLSVVSVAPTLHATNGWTGTGAWNALTTGGIYPTENFTVIVMFANASGTFPLFGERETGKQFALDNRTSTGFSFVGGASRSVTGISGSGVACQAGQKTYHDGVLKATSAGTYSGASAVAISLMGYTNVGTVATTNHSIAAAAIYDNILDAAEIAAVGAAMAAL